MTHTAGTCPSCERTVGPGESSCPDCGSQLSLTRVVEFEPGSTFADRYTIIEQIGSGGMGVVYKAIDTRLDDFVALKLIHSSLADVPRLAQRFRREVRITRQITHPNICRVHDIGESDGCLFLSMEWIEGETLDRLLRQAGTLRAARSLHIVKKIAFALEAAHEKGVVHRDLKPANVMLDRRGSVKVLDFGLATDDDSPRLTGAGVVVGTVAYMAPEQRQGKRPDARADLYTLGLMLFEMVTGSRFPTTESSPVEYPPELNPAMEPVLDRLLAADPEDRYQSAREVREALEILELDPAISRVSSGDGPASGVGSSAFTSILTRLEWSRTATWIGGVTLGLILIAALAYWLWPEPPPRINEQALVFYDNGLRQLREEGETASSLHNAIQLFNRAQNEDPDSALVMAGLGESYWRLYDRTRAVTAREEAERWLTNGEQIEPELPELLLARAVGLIVEGKYDAAKAQLETVVDARPDLAQAWLELGVVNRELEDYGAGVEALKRAEKLWPESFRVQLGWGIFYDHFQEHGQAEAHFRRSTDLKPDSRIAWNNLATSLLFQGKFEESIEPLERSIEIEEYGDARSNLGTALYFLGRYEDAVKQYSRATELEPQRADHRGNLGDAYLALGREKDANESYAEAARLAMDAVLREPLSPKARSDAALYCALAGKADCALENAAKAAELQPDNATAMLVYATVLCRFDRDDESLHWLGQSVSFGMSRAQIEARPEFARLHDDPRYQAILDLAD